MTGTPPLFPGVVGTTVADSVPWWEDSPGRGRSRPNVVVVILDDTGWSDLGCFGSEIATPAIDALAASGVRYNRFHVTPLCSPTRAALLSGRNNHAIGMRFLADTDTGFPNSRGSIRTDAELLPQRLRREGYGTYLVGKWHLTPLHEITPAGPFGNWPLARGFDRFYGFLDGCTDQYEPELYRDNSAIPVPEREGYHLSEDLADEAIGFVSEHLAFRRHQPFFLQLALGATHAPFQAPREYIDKYVDVFAKGWDATRADRLRRQVELGVVPAGTELAERNEGVQPWDELTEDERTVATHLQAAFAGFLEHADAQLGRFLAALERFGVRDDTVVVLLSDNGASREGGRLGDVDTNAPYSGVRRTAAEQLPLLDRVGGPLGGSHYPEGWAMAGNTPFRQYKQFVDLGGVRSPLILSWPKGPAAAGEVRSAFVHAIDIAPTLYELLGIEDAPPADGASVAPTLARDDAEAGRSTQYWETLGHRAVWHDGWKAVTVHRQGDDYAEDAWRLYDTRADFSESADLAGSEPERLRELQDLWWQQAERFDVFPLDDRPLYELINTRGPEGLFAESELRLRPGQHVPFSSGVTGSNRSISVTAELARAAAGASGALLSSGNAQGGYLLGLRDGVPFFEHSSLGEAVRLTASEPLAAGERSCGFDLVARLDGTGRVELVVGGEAVDARELALTSGHLSFWGLDVGRTGRTTFSSVAAAPFVLPAGLLQEVRVAVHAEADDEREYAQTVLVSE